MGVLFGLIAAVNWGVGDFCARFATTRIGNFRAYFYMQLAGLLGLSAWLLIQPPANWDWFYSSLAAGLGATNTIAGLALYRAFETGLLSVVSPVAASYGAISLALGLLSGQPISLSELTGLVFTIMGVILAATPLGLDSQVELEQKARSGSGTGFALLASLFLFNSLVFNKH